MDINEKKFWRRKTDGKLILNPLNPKHLIKCTTNPCGDYWAIFGKRRYQKDNYNKTNNPFSYSVDIYFVKDGKAQWIEREWNEDQGEYVTVDKCASIDINGRPNGLQKFIEIVHKEVVVQYEDWYYDEDTDEQIYIPPVYEWITKEYQTITEWYRISPCFKTKQQALAAYYFPCGITEGPYPPIDYQNWECYKKYWILKTIKVSSPLFEFRRETMNVRYKLTMDQDQRTTALSSFTYFYNPTNKQVCENNSAQCVSKTVNFTVFTGYYSGNTYPYTMGCWMLMPARYVGYVDYYHDYRFVSAIEITETNILGCYARQQSFRDASNILAPIVRQKLLDKNTYFDSYYFGNRDIVTVSGSYSIIENSPWVSNRVSYSGGGNLIRSETYQVSPRRSQDYNQTSIDSQWLRFAYKKTSQTLQEAIGLKLEITITDSKYDEYPANSSVLTSSFTTQLQYGKYYQDLPIVSYFNVMDLIYTCECVTYEEYDQETGKTYIWDQQVSGMCLPKFNPGIVNDERHLQRQKFNVNIKILDVIFPEEFIKSGYALSGELNYDQSN